MSARPHAYACVRVPTHRGNPPNTYQPQITAEVRLAWTPTSTRAVVLAALMAAVDDALHQFAVQPDTYDQPVLRVGVDIDSVGLPLRAQASDDAARAAAERYPRGRSIRLDDHLVVEGAGTMLQLARTAYAAGYRERRAEAEGA